MLGDSIGLQIGKANCSDALDLFLEGVNKIPEYNEEWINECIILYSRILQDDARTARMMYLPKMGYNSD